MSDVEISQTGLSSKLKMLYGDWAELCVIEPGSANTTLSMTANGLANETEFEMTQQHAAALWPLLKCFAETGRLVREGATTNEKS